MKLARVLVVDDEALICELLVDALEEAGQVVTCAGGYETALDELAAHAATLKVLVTDINLGTAKTGFDLAREARLGLPALVVIYVTGNAAADMESCGVEGAILLPKPYAAGPLATRVAELVAAAIAEEA